MKKIPLLHGLVAIVDDEDYERVMRYHWNINKTNDLANAYVKTKVPCARAKDGFTTMYLHRFIMSPPLNMIVDHINHNRLDCRKSNMRITTQAGNQHNRMKPTHMRGNPTSSKYKGVYYYSGRPNPWRAQIQMNNIHIHLGVFANEESAARAYDQAAMEMYGDSACLNFPIKKGQQSCLVTTT
jgi:hypothetical protein